jgi:hypothetical protein
MNCTYLFSYTEWSSRCRSHAVSNKTTIYASVVIKCYRYIPHSMWHCVPSYKVLKVIIPGANAQLDGILQFSEYILETRLSQYTLADNVPRCNPPDFSLWSLLKGKVYTNEPHTINYLSENIRHEITAIPVEMLQRVYPSVCRIPSSCSMDAGGCHFQHPVRRDAVSQGLRCMPTIFDHHRCINSGFVAESQETLARESLYILLFYKIVFISRWIWMYNWNWNVTFLIGHTVVILLMIGKVLIENIRFI